MRELEGACASLLCLHLQAWMVPFRSLSVLADSAQTVALNADTKPKAASQRAFSLPMHDSLASSG